MLGLGRYKSGARVVKTPAGTAVAVGTAEDLMKEFPDAAADMEEKIRAQVMEEMKAKEDDPEEPAGAGDDPGKEEPAGSDTDPEKTDPAGAAGGGADGDKNAPAGAGGKEEPAMAGEGQTKDRGGQPVPASFSELSGAFQGHDGFIVKAQAAGMTMGQAAAAFRAEMDQKITAAGTQRAPGPAASASGPTAADFDSCIDQVRREQFSHLPPETGRRKALGAAQDRFPAQYQAWRRALRDGEINGGKVLDK